MLFIIQPIISYIVEVVWCHHICCLQMFLADKNHKSKRSHWLHDYIFSNTSRLHIFRFVHNWCTIFMCSRTHLYDKHCILSGLYKAAQCPFQHLVLTHTATGCNGCRILLSSRTMLRAAFGILYTMGAGILCFIALLFRNPDEECPHLIRMGP